MNTPGALGASGAVRPFYDRAGAAGPPPETIVRTALGTNQVVNALGIDDLSAPSATVLAGETILVGVMWNNQVNVDEVHVYFGGGPELGEVNRQPILPSTTFTVVLYALLVAADTTDLPTVNFTASTGQPTVAAMWVSKVAGLASPLAVDRTARASGNSGTQDSGLTAVTTQAHEYACGVIGTNGTAGDTVGAWQAGFSAGQSVGNAQCQLKEGYGILTATGQQRAEVTGATARRYAALCATFKAA